MKSFIFLLSIYCSLSCFANYPKVWWTEIPRESAKSWEILPQDAKVGEVILSKRTELGLLSNFAATPLVIDSIMYPSLEGFWQMMKYPDSKIKNDPRSQLNYTLNRRQVAQLTGFDAKRAGKQGSENMKLLKIDWVSYQGKKMTYRSQLKGTHYQLIVRATLAKVTQNKKVKNLLLKTKGLELKPDHSQGDNPPPAWQYHKILMMIRDQIKK